MVVRHTNVVGLKHVLASLFMLGTYWLYFIFDY